MNFIPYGKQSINQDDIESVVEVLKSDYLTTGSKGSPEFEKGHRPNLLVGGLNYWGWACLQNGDRGAFTIFIPSFRVPFLRNSTGGIKGF